MNRIVRIALTALTALTAAVAITASPANASIGSMSANLGLGRIDCSNWALGCQQEVWVNGLVRTSSTSEALQLVNSNYRIEVRLWGDDPASDDLLYGAIYASTEIRPDPNGLYFSTKFWMDYSLLNEDQSWTDNRDEVYAGVRLVNSSGSTIRSAETNRLYGYF